MSELTLEKWKNILASIRDTAIVIDRKSGKVLYANTNTTGHFGYTIQELTGASFADKLLPATFSDELIAEGKYVVDLLHKQGFLVRSTLQLIPLNGEVLFIIAPDEADQDKALLNRYAELMHVLLVELNLSGQIVRVNHPVGELLEKPREELIGTDWFALVPIDSGRTDLEKKFHGLINGNIAGPVFTVNPFKLPDGSYRLLSWRMNLIQDPEGLTTGVLCAGEDVSEKNDLIELLNKKEADFQLLFDNMQEGVLHIDLEGRVVLANPKFCEISDLTCEEILGKRHTDLVTDQETKKLLEGMLERRRLGITDVYEVRITTKGGEHRWLKTTGAPVRDRSGNIIGALSISEDITEKKEMEKALEWEGRKYQSIVAGIPDLIFIIDKECRYVACHKDDNQDTLVPPSLFIGKTIREVMPHPLGEKHSEAVLKVFQTGAPITLEYYIDKMFHKEVREYFETRIVQVDQDHVMALVRNITTQKTIQLALEENEFRMSAMLNAIAEPIIRFSEDGTCLDYKPGNHEKNATIKAYRGKSISKLFPANIANLHLDKIRETIQTGKSLQYEFERVIPESGLCFFEVRTAKSGSHQAVLIIRDITRRKEMVEALLHSRELYSQAERIAQLGSWEYDYKSQKSLFSDQFYRICGFDPDTQFPGPIPPLDFIDHENVSELIELIEKSLSKKGEFELSIRIKRPDGKKLEVLCIGKLLRDREGNPTRLTGVVQDVTALRRLERELQERNTELSTFIYRTSHSLRSPLTSALGLLNLARKEEGGNSVPYLELIEGLIKKLDNILLELINVIMIKGGAVKPEQVDANAFIKDIIKEYNFHNLEQELRFNLDLPEDGWITTDKQLLRAILTNLVENAVKYRSRNRKSNLVKISLKKKKTRFSVRVEDNGIGIPEEAQSRVFDMFFRATEVSPGTGMGLYIVKNAVDKLEGEIRLESAAGKGTKITISLPDGVPADNADTGK